MSMGPSTRGFPGRPNEPFFFGRGGRRMSAEDISLQRRLAAQQMAQGTDFSPVGHWTQGAARALTGGLGALQMRQADKASEERAAGQQQSIEALLAYDPTSGGPDPVAAALADPDLRQLGMSVLESRTPKVPAPTEFERMLAAANILPGTPEYIEANRRAAMAKSDPLITATLPGDRFYSGPQSELARVLGGAPPPSAAGGPPAVLPPDFDFGDPAPMSAPSSGASFMTPAQFQAIVDQHGRAWADNYARKHNIQVHN